MVLVNTLLHVKILLNPFLFYPCKWLRLIYDVGVIQAAVYLSWLNSFIDKLSIFVDAEEKDTWVFFFIRITKDADKGILFVVKFAYLNPVKFGWIILFVFIFVCGIGISYKPLEKFLLPWNIMFTGSTDMFMFVSFAASLSSITVHINLLSWLLFQWSMTPRA